MVLANKRISILVVLVLLASLVSVLFMAKTTRADDAAPSDKFSDLSSLSSSDKAKFDSLLQKGIFSGVSDTSFGVDQNMNRAQFAKVAALVFGLKTDSSITSSSFSDVTADDPSNGYALPYIEAIKAAGITSGVDDTHYDPAGTVTREQLATFLIRGLGLDDKAKAATPVDDSTVSSWAKSYVALALQDKIMDNQGDSFNGTTPATRYMLAMAAYATLDFKNNGSASSDSSSSSSSSSSSNSSDSGAAVSAQGKSMAVVGRARTNGSAAEDQAIIKEMQNLGFRTTWVDESTLTADKLNQFDIVYFSPTLNEKYVKDGQMKGVTVPQVYGKFRGLQGLQLADQPTSDTSSQNSTSGTGSRSITFSGDNITVDAKDNPITKGFSGDVEVFKDVSSDATKTQIYVDSSSISKLAKSAEIFATPSTNSDSASVIAYEKGAKAEDGSTTNARIIFLIGKIGFQDQITSDGFKVMDNAVLWALQN